jgi:hypothetical protein
LADEFKETYFGEVIKDGASLSLGTTSKCVDINDVEFILDFDSVADAILEV